MASLIKREETYYVQWRFDKKLKRKSFFTCHTHTLLMAILLVEWCFIVFLILPSI